MTRFEITFCLVITLLRKLVGGRRGFFAALRYLETNAASFEKSGYVLASQQSGTITKYLTSALDRFFGAASDEDVTTPPSPDVFIEAAAEHERNDP